MMKELHEQGKTIEDIVEVLKRTPIHPRVVPAIKAVHALGYFLLSRALFSCFLKRQQFLTYFFIFYFFRCDLRIVSDANLFFIETILEHLGLRNCFSEINTNPGFVDEQGRLRILPFHDFNKGSHGCTGPCPPNMCKV